MPRAKSICSWTGCVKPATLKGRCPDHPFTRYAKPWEGGTGDDLPKNWDEIKKQTLDRDRRTCYRCGRYATQVDHITPRFMGGTHMPWNLSAICVECHKHKSALEGVLARKMKRENGTKI